MRHYQLVGYLQNMGSEYPIDPIVFGFKPTMSDIKKALNNYEWVSSSLQLFELLKNNDHKKVETIRMLK